jgi:hypothetical protein
MAHFFVSESRQQVTKIQDTQFLIAGLEKRLDFLGLVDWTNRFHVLGPVAIAEQLRDAIGF